MDNMSDFVVFWNLGYYAVMLGLLVLLIAAWWKLFEKAGEPGWTALIPFYNTYLLFKIAGRKKMFWGMLAAQIIYVISAVVAIVTGLFTIVFSLGYMFRSGYNGYSEEDQTFTTIVVLLLISCAVWVVAMVAMAILQGFLVAGIARNFGQGGGFAVGLYLLPYVFYPILAFRSDIYYVPEGQGQSGCLPRYGYQGGTGVPPQFVYLPPQNPYAVPPQEGYIPPQNPYAVPPRGGYIPPQGSYAVPPQGANIPQERGDTVPQNGFVSLDKGEKNP